MPWRDSVSLPFTRIAIVAQVPSESGVYAVFHGEKCVLIGNTWNLKAHLLELITGISDSDELSIKYEVLPEERAAERSETLNRELKKVQQAAPSANGNGHLPGITFWDNAAGADPSNAHEA